MSSSPIRQEPIIREKTNTTCSQSSSVLSLVAWEEELENDEDRVFILNGLRNGFDIIDPDAYPAMVEYENNISARPGSLYYKKANAQVLK